MKSNRAIKKRSAFFLCGGPTMGKRKVLIAVVFTVIIAVMLINFSFLYFAPCTRVEKMDAHLKVKIVSGRAMLGLNADTDSLNFGVVSPGIAAMRKINVQHSNAASVIVRMDGELGPWTNISPAEFNLSAGETKEVAFEIMVPLYALQGNYTGKAAVCIKEK